MVTASSGFSLDKTLPGILPPPPARLLLLSASPLPFLAQLEAMGYQVSGFSLDNALGFAQWPTPTREAIYQFDLPLAESDAASFGAAIVVGLSVQTHPLALWDQLAHWLTTDALVVLAAPQSPRPARMLHWLEHVAAMGARCGFSEQDEALSSADVRVFRRASVPRWQLRHVRPRDFEGVAALFQEVFGHALSRALWDWKYADGHGNAVVAARNGVLIAHYGGMYRDVMLCGKADWVFQICDVMVHPQERGVMTRQGPFLLTAASSAEIYGPLGFGFPNARAMLVAAKMGLYSEVGQMAEVRWQPAKPRFRLGSRVAVLKRGDVAGQAQVESLWAAMARDLRSGVVGVRNWAHLEQRYFSHPHNQYDVLAITSRFTGKPLGVLVLRRLETSCELMDVIAPLANLPLLLDQARRLTALWGLPYLYCWITKNYMPLFLSCAGKEEAINVSIPTSCWTDDPRAEVFKDKWWLMSGDTDFR
ncbi:MAG: GNAT family N-acetyltransferase [Pseudomonadota bacterium]